MSEERDANVQEFKLEPDCELRFEVESKNEKVILEVSYTIFAEPQSSEMYLLLPIMLSIHLHM
jgi:hypothetical protein